MKSFLVGLGIILFTIVFYPGIKEFVDAWVVAFNAVHPGATGFTALLVNSAYLIVLIALVAVGLFMMIKPVIDRRGGGYQ